MKVITVTAPLDVCLLCQVGLLLFFDKIVLCLQHYKRDLAHNSCISILLFLFVSSERRALPRSQTEIRGPTAIGWHGNDTEVGQPPPIGWKKEYLSPPDYAQTQELARTDVHNTQTPSVIGSRSLPSSPYKTSPQRRSELEDDAAVRASDSEYDARDGRTDEALTNPAVPSTSATAADGHRPADRKRRFHNGAYYVEIGGEMPVEMETVL